MRLVFLLTLCLAGCQLPCCRSRVSVESQSVPESVQIDGRTFRLAAELWRDFQPISPPGGQPMMGVVRIIADDNLALPEDLRIEYIRFVHNDGEWTPRIRIQPEPLHLHLTGGPKWEPGTTAEAVVRLRRQDQSWLLRTSSIPIIRTD